MRLQLDNILLGIAVTACVLSAMGTFWLAHHPAEPGVLPVHISGGEYLGFVSPLEVKSGRVWTAPPAQSKDGLWVYDVFTPPKIYIHPETRLFSVIPYTGPVAVQPFNLLLTRLEWPFYRLQFEGYIEEDLSDPEQTLIQLYDREADRLRIVRVGQRSEQGQFRIVEFSRGRSLDENGFLERRATVKVDDLRHGIRVQLHSGQIQYVDRPRFHFRSQNLPEDSIIIEGVDDPLEYKGFIFRILELEPTEPSVLMERMDPETGQVRRQRLVPETVSPSALLFMDSLSISLEKKASRVFACTLSHYEKIL